MDGFKRRLKESIQFRLSLSLSLAILLVAVLAGVFSFISALDEAHELQDDSLRQVASLFEQQHLSASRLSAINNVEGKKEKEEESHVTIQYLTASDAVPDSLPVPPSLPDGMHTLQLDEYYRVLIKTLPDGERIAVAQEIGVRDEIARNSALRTLMPFLILMPILLLLVANLVRKMFRPIASLAADIDQRSEQDLRPVEASHLPTETRSFVVAINRLLDRVAQAMQTQRRFVADAAHELRTPLTALSLQAERLAEADMSAGARERLITLRQGIQRGRDLIDQLLNLAKAQAAVNAPASPVSVQQVYRQVLEQLMPLAETKQIDIGVEGEQDANVVVNEADLLCLLKNLVDNAIRYTPSGGRVDLSVSSDEHQTVLLISDTGPGITPVERERVFDPFYRLLGHDEAGSGLGLSIVRAIAERIGAQVTLAFTDEAAQSGLSVRIRLRKTASNQ